MQGKQIAIRWLVRRRPALCARFSHLHRQQVCGTLIQHVSRHGVVTMLEQVFPGQTEMARRMRALDWSTTPLGPVEQWPQSLKTSVSICLDCAFPIVLWWGPQLTILYNDEYCPYLGTKHPMALGEPGAKVWAEIWDVIDPMLSTVMERGEATRSRDLMLFIARNGYPEEAYFSFSYSPILVENGEVGGVFCPVIETTEKIIGERRLRLLRDLAASCKGADNETAAFDAVASVLASDPHDVPFAMVYEVSDDGTLFELSGAAGIAPGHDAAPRTLRIHARETGLWSLGKVARSGRLELIEDLGSRFGDLPTGAWKTAPHCALVLPVALPGHERPRAILVAAVSPMRALDDPYRTFYSLLANQIAAGLADARAMEEERRRAEALADIDRAKTAFFSNVSHEFRTPLTLMMGPLEDALSGVHGALPPLAAQTLSVAHRNSRRLLKLVNTLLDFSRIEAGRVDASYEPTDLCAFTADLASVFRSAVERAGLELVVDCRPLAAPAFVDRDMWEKIVLNLLSNALKHTFDGRITVALHQAGDRLVLSVSDTGVGIPAAEVPRVFDRFHRVKDARSRTHEGTGIGLALVNELVKLHGGEVAVSSEEGLGATFYVSIPAGCAHLPPDRIGAGRRLASTGISAVPFVEEALRWLPDDGPGDAAPAVEEMPVSRQPAGAGARILVADDNADMRDYLTRLLSAQYEVAVVPDGEAALEAIRRQPPDLVVADVMMPRRDGFGLLAALRTDEQTRTLPVVLLSARAGEEARIEGLSAGADDYLTKPFSARELLARIGSQLELAQVRREAEGALRTRGVQFESLIDAAPIGIYLLDAGMKILQVNPVARPFFGELGDSVIGRDFVDVIHELRDDREYADEIVALFRHTLETGEPYITAEKSGRRGNGSGGVYFEWRLDRITLPDGTFGLVCYFRDVSAQVAARRAVEESREALRAADRRKDEFLATLAHELRNPLAPIRNALRVLRLSDDGVVSSRTVEMMERQVSHMVRLVDDLLEVSRITRGKIELQRRQVDLADVVHSAVETSRPLIEAGRHLLSLQLPDEPVRVSADPVRIAQVLSNLLNNAAKYTGDGGRIWLSLARAGAHAVLSVRDNGAGIPRDALPSVFDLFMQVERTYDSAQGGLGIGLTLVRSLVRMHGGTVEARSDGPGQGSEFIVRLPLTVAEPLEHCGDDPGRNSGARVRSRILVVDDSRDAADSLDMLLRFLGAEVHTAYDGPAALAALEPFKPSVVLLDIGLPGMDGYEVARAMRAHPDGAALTIIALSGWGQDEDRRRSQEAGFDHHLIKPVDPEALAQLLASLPARTSSPAVSTA